MIIEVILVYSTVHDLRVQIYTSTNVYFHTTPTTKTSVIFHHRNAILIFNVFLGPVTFFLFFFFLPKDIYIILYFTLTAPSVLLPSSCRITMVTKIHAAHTMLGTILRVLTFILHLVFTIAGLK